MLEEFTPQLNIEDNQKKGIKEINAQGQDTASEVDVQKNNELLDITPEKLVQNEKTFLGKFKEKTKDLAKVLILITALTAGAEFVHAQDLSERESEKIEQVEKKKEASFYKLEFIEKEETPQEIMDNIKIVYIQAINNGKTRPIILSQKDLEKNPSLDIDGYIANIMIFCKEEINIDINESDFRRINKFENDNYIGQRGKSIYPYHLETDDYPEEYWQEIMKNDIVQDEQGGSFLKGGYYYGQNPININYLGEPISNIENNEVVFKINDETYKLPIKQKVFQKFNKDFKLTKDGLEFNYLGNDLNRFSAIEEINEKLSAIAEGVNNVENISSDNLVNQIQIVDYNKSNAFADQQKKTISFHPDCINKKSLEELRVTSEHETLHKFVFENGFTENMDIRNMFADLKGYINNQKTCILRDGFAPFDNYNYDYKNKTFFAFIDEHNFFNQENGGHSFGNIYEFMTSFYHTLMYIDRLEDELDDTVLIKHIMGKPQKVILSEDDKVLILDHYISLIEMTLENTENIPVIGKFYNNKTEEFLKNKLVIVKKIKNKLTVK